MEKKFIFAVCVLAIGLLVYLFFYLKKDSARKEVERQKAEVERQKARARSREKKELIEACKNADIDKVIELLEKGLDPNITVQVWVNECWSSPPEYCDCSHYETRTLLDISSGPALRKLLRSYGAKTIKAIREEEAAIEKARHDAEVAEIRRQDAILEAEKKAKEEADMQKVEAFLASKKA